MHSDSRHSDLHAATARPRNQREAPRIAIYVDRYGFGDVWAGYCRDNDVPFKTVHCDSDDILDQMQDCEALIWWWAGRDKTFAHQLTCALELQGKHVSPSAHDSWHIDDKIAQKYMFEVTALPVPRSYVFYDKDTALSWVETADFPKIFKLRASTDSNNVWSVDSAVQARRFIRRAFKQNFTRLQKARALSTSITRLRNTPSSKAFRAVVKDVARAGVSLLPRVKSDTISREYAFFQDFLKGVIHTYLVLVTKDKVFALRQAVRANDFRVSGSGLLEPGHPGIIPKSCIEMAFICAKKLRTERLGLEMVLGESGEPIIMESDPFSPMKDTLPGFWDRSLRWHGTPTTPAIDILIDLTHRVTHGGGG